ncbi:MAG: hypothetical protein Kow00124_09280 [Anaerolineae bacterium]
MGMKAVIRVLIADDNLAVRRSLMLLLGSTPGIEPVGQAAHGQQALELCETLRPDILVLDLNMPGPGGIETMRRIREACPWVSVLVLTGSTDRSLLNDALQAGASACLTKDTTGERLLAAIRGAASAAADNDSVITA